VFYMGLSLCPLISEQLQHAGMPASMPVALIERGTTPAQRVISGTLAQLPSLAEGVASPALIMVGSVVTLGQKLAWFGHSSPPINPAAAS